MKRKHLLSQCLILSCDITMKFDLSFSVCLSNHNNNNFYYFALSHIFFYANAKEVAKNLVKKIEITRLEVFCRKGNFVFNKIEQVMTEMP